MKRRPVIAIDGPAAAGKTTVARRVADELGYFCFDTGLLYRAATWHALELGIPVTNGEALGRMLRAAEIMVAPPSVADGRAADVVVAGRDVSLELRRPEVDRNVSTVAAHREVRSALVEAQRRVARRQPTVMAGRDIGTVIVPDAGLKVFLTASPRERARRRLAETQPYAGQGDLDTALEALRVRDELDSTRDAAPLRKAEDAVEIDSSDLEVEEVVRRIVSLARERNLAVLSKTKRETVADRAGGE